MASFYGKHRGVVIANQDPLMLGRIKVRVPDVLDPDGAWAMPCAPAGGETFVPPAEGTGVWVEFERGDASYPIWSGVWWGTADEVPGIVEPSQGKLTLETKGGHSVTLDDAPGVGGITLETSDGQRLAIGPSGIAIDNGRGARIRLSGPSVSINEGALEVT